MRADFQNTLVRLVGLVRIEYGKGDVPIDVVEVVVDDSKSVGPASLDYIAWVQDVDSLGITIGAVVNASLGFN